MRLEKLHSVLIITLLSFSMLVFMSGCSNKKDINSVAVKSTVKNSVVTKLPHAHPSNPCTAALNHSHIYQKKEHQHSYDCENTNEYVSNAHIHPATKGHRKFRHVHPNGASKHSHHRE